ncbi:MAG: hypothetical protein ISS23_01300 [Nanoarchaeota archaeon]|nr:hypothetical protein [Nanoarchaeota archaeon]
MNEEKAVRILTAELAKHSDSLVVREKQYKDKLVENADYFHQVRNPFIIGFDKFNVIENKSETSYTRWGFVNNDRTKTEYTREGPEYIVYQTLEDAINAEKNCKNANYFFVDKPLPVISNNQGSQGSGMSFFVTPYFIIGKKEINDLRGLFYKDVSEEIVQSMNFLNIQNFIGLYDFYIGSATFDKDLMLYLSDVQNFISLVPALSYDGDGEIKVSAFESAIKSINDLNSALEIFGMEEGGISTTKYRKSNIKSHPDYIHKKSLLEIIDQLQEKWKYFFMDSEANFKKDFLKSFFGFIFSLPYEEQNVKVNKEILRNFMNSDFVVSVLCKEYSGGKFFEEYFDVLDEAVQDRIVRALKHSDLDNIVYNSFLWRKGFKDIDLDYLDLYQKDASGFIEYFKSKDGEEQKIILEDIMDLEFISLDVVDWLNENESKLMKEVSFDG